MTGISLGGHFAPRAVAYEPRFASGACWGANHNWAEVQQKRLKREGENPVPHYWAHVMWAFGATDMDDFLAKAADMNLNGHMDRIRVPFLVTHGARRPPDQRRICARSATTSWSTRPRRELKIFTDARRRRRACRRRQHGFRPRLYRRLVRRDARRAYAIRSPEAGREIMNAPVRRIVTGHEPTGAPSSRKTAPAPRVQRIGGEIGPMFHEVWNTRATPAPIDAASGEPPESGIVLAPPKGGTRIRVLDIPPEDDSFGKMTPEAGAARISPKSAPRTHRRTPAKVAAMPSCTAPRRSTTAS